MTTSISGTYFVTSRCPSPLFQTARTAELFLDHLQRQRTEGRFLLYAFVIMPDHFHVIFTPKEISIERAVQFIKGGFSFRIKRELGIAREIWQPKYHDRRIRDAQECVRFVRYLEMNPVRRGLAATVAAFDYSSATRGGEVCSIPCRIASAPEGAGCEQLVPRLKPGVYRKPHSLQGVVEYSEWCMLV